MHRCVCAYACFTCACACAVSTLRKQFRHNTLTHPHTHTAVGERGCDNNLFTETNPYNELWPPPSVLKHNCAFISSTDRHTHTHGTTRDTLKPYTTCGIFRVDVRLNFSAFYFLRRRFGSQCFEINDGSFSMCFRCTSTTGNAPGVSEYVAKAFVYWSIFESDNICASVNR